MAGLGLLFGGLAGAGNALAQDAKRAQALADEQVIAEQRARLEEERLLRIDEARRQRERAGQLRMGEEINTATARMLNEQDAAAINAKFGSTATAEDVAALRSNPEARRAYGLLDATRQSDLETRAAAAESLGYLEAARETRGQLNTEIANQRQDAQDKANTRRLDLQEERQKQQDEYNRRRESRLDRLAEAELAFRQAQAKKLDAREEKQTERELRLATNNALAGVNNQLKSLEKEAADPLLAPEQKEVIRAQMIELRAEGERYRRALASAGLEGSTAPSKPFDPNDFRTGGQGQGGGASSNQRAPAQSAPAAPAAPSAPARRESPRELALRGYDAAIQQTVRELTAAQNRGDSAEVKRLNELLQQQQAAKARTSG